MASPSPAVLLTQVRKNFGSVPALTGLDLALAPGETLALLGRNGAGKSTAINLLLGLDEPDAGRAELFGGPPRTAVGAGLVGAMLQDARPIPRVTVRELTAFVAATYPRPMRPAEALALAGIGELADRRVDKLSGGQAQRLRFALAVTGNPALIVLDEPTAALDVEARRAATPCCSPRTTWRRPTRTPTASSSSTAAGPSPTAPARRSSGGWAARWSPSTWPAGAARACARCRA
jgi:ABC-2 type transport system ATP-binding protein